MITGRVGIGRASRELSVVSSPRRLEPIRARPDVQQVEPLEDALQRSVSAFHLLALEPREVRHGRFSCFVWLAKRRHSTVLCRSRHLFPFESTSINSVRKRARNFCTSSPSPPTTTKTFSTRPPVGGPTTRAVVSGSPSTSSLVQDFCGRDVASEAAVGTPLGSLQNTRASSPRFAHHFWKRPNVSFAVVHVVHADNRVVRVGLIVAAARRRTSSARLRASLSAHEDASFWASTASSIRHSPPSSPKSEVRVAAKRTRVSAISVAAPRGKCDALTSSAGASRGTRGEARRAA